ncbi:MAG: ATP synthase F1 subunit delta [Candidatus Aminicenantes bacterium RBG_16_63_14]|nr:MAG: ATP synthase F1 subunit delta [Candidatus Aminicenantes bacterium RBG_16_63_14]OGD29387.1 MAG: ATP synthase F1 subunit delta [Candidatus Aminicenantes bacterium RBG_19FT_COMBO_65_30]
MKNRALVKKYAEGLAQALEDEREYESVGAEIRTFLDLFVSREDLRRALVSPFVNAAKKKAILDEVMARAGTGPKASRFLALLLHHKRLELLPGIVDALPEAWSEKHGVVTYEVTSAVPLAAGQKDRLAKGLEASEKKPVRLVAKIDPAVVGGLALRKGHIVYDASVEGELTALKERLGQR